MIFNAIAIQRTESIGIQLLIDCLYDACNAIERRIQYKNEINRMALQMKPKSIFWRYRKIFLFYFITFQFFAVCFHFFVCILWLVFFYTCISVLWIICHFLIAIISGSILRFNQQYLFILLWKLIGLLQIHLTFGMRMLKKTKWGALKWEGEQIGYWTFMCGYMDPNTENASC